MASRDRIDQAFASVAQGDCGGVTKILASIAYAENVSLEHIIVILRDHLGRNLLHIASRHGNIEMIRLFLEDNLSSLTHRDHLLFGLSMSGDNGIAWAVRSGQAEAVNELFLQGLQEIDHRNILGSSAMHIATTLNNEDTLQTLIDLGGDHTMPNAAGETPLHLAARHGYIAIATRLILAGASLDVVDSHGFTALHRAVERRKDGMVEFLLQRGASHRILDRRGFTPFITAVLAALRGENTNGVLARLAAGGLF